MSEGGTEVGAWYVDFPPCLIIDDRNAFTPVIKASYTWYFSATWNVVGGFIRNHWRLSRGPCPFTLRTERAGYFLGTQDGAICLQTQCRSAGMRIHQLTTGTTPLGAF